MLISKGTTAVPNAVFDDFLSELKLAELKILLVIIRQTLGWEDRQNENGRKQRDWISSSQMLKKTGCSERAISSAIESLTKKNLISVFDLYGSLLDSPSQRKGKTKLFFSLTCLSDRQASAKNAIVDYGGKTGANECGSRNTSANFAGNFRKNCAQLAQKMRITK